MEHFWGGDGRVPDQCLLLQGRSVGHAAAELRWADGDREEVDGGEGLGDRDGSEDGGDRGRRIGLVE